MSDVYLTARAELCHRLFRSWQTERFLRLWFEAEMNVLQHEGLVDVKMTVFPNEQTTTASVLTTLVNVYRMRRLGLCVPVDVS
jgi:hypothetical protein